MSLTWLLLVLLTTYATSGAAPGPSPPAPVPGRLFFFAIASRQYGWYCDMLHSAVHNKIPMHIFGWRNRRLTKQTKVLKIPLILEALRTVPPDTVVVMVDAFDVLFAKGEEEIKAAYEKLNADVVIGCERPCYNEMLWGDECYKAFPRSPAGYGGLNSGALIGKAGAISQLYERARHFRDQNPKQTQVQRSATDQGFVGQAYLEARDKKQSVVLDCNETVIQNLYLAAPDFCKGDLFNCNTNTYPSIFHFNGGKMREKPVARWRKRFWWANKPTDESTLIWINGTHQNLSQVCRANHGDFVRYWA